jgi:flagellar hook-associated protein 1 FlgK
MGGFGSLYVGTAGLQTSQNALNTTAHNLSNVDTTGYTRQQVLQADGIYNNLKASYLSQSQIGLGSTIAAVRQVRDTFLDSEYRISLGRQGFYEESYNTIYEIENYFGELESVKFNDSLQTLWNAVSEVAKQPDDSVKLATLKEMAVTFVSRAEAVYQGLSDYQVKMNLQISDTVDTINELSKSIYELNHQIRDVELAGTENANDLRDARNAALDELSSYLHITYDEDAESMVHVRTEGVELVTGMNYHTMEVQTDNISGFATPYWSHLGTEVFDFSVPITTSLNTDIGSLKALVLARGDHRGTYADIPVQPVESDYATTAEYEAAVSQYKDDLKEYNTYTSSSAILNVEAELDQLFHGIVTAMNDILCPNTTVSFTDDTGTAYTLTVLDTEAASYGSEGQQGVELFARKDVPRYTEQTYMINGEAVTYQVYNEEDLSSSLDRSSWYSIGKVEVNEAVLKDPTSLGTVNLQGEADFEKGEALTAAWSEPFSTLNPNMLDPDNFMDYYAALISEVGNLGSVYNGSATAMAQASEYLDQKRTEVTGVSSDEELTNMIKYQSAYNAASRYITTVSEMLETLIVSLGA